MKLWPANADPDAIPHGLKDVQVRATKRWGIIAQTRPQRQPRSTQLQKQYRTRFGLAGRMAANPGSLDLLTAIEMARGTEQVPRDILTMAALGAYYLIVNPDGTTWRRPEKPVLTDPDAIRRPALTLAKTVLPPDPAYLVLEDGDRLKLTATP